MLVTATSRQAVWNTHARDANEVGWAKCNSTTRSTDEH